MSLDMYDNDGQARFSIYRGPNKVWPLTSNPPDLPGQIQNASTKNAPELFANVANGLSDAKNNATHVVYLDPIDYDLFRPLQKDEVNVDGTALSLNDGLYSIVEDPIPHNGLDPSLDYIKLMVRYLGPKKQGDVRKDNSGIIRMGPRRA